MEVGMRVARARFFACPSPSSCWRKLVAFQKVWNSVIIFEQQQLTPFLASPSRLGPDLMADGLVGLPQQILQKYNVIGQRAKQD